MIDEPDLDVKGLLKHVKGPDFPTGGEILNAQAELREIYETGQGADPPARRVHGRDAAARQAPDRRHVDPVRRQQGASWSSSDRRARSSSRKLPQVVDVRDESTTDVRIVLELKTEAVARGGDGLPLQAHRLQTNFNVNLTCLLPTANPLVGQPARVTLRDLCRQFLDFRMMVVTRRLEHEKRKLEARLHILDALAKIYDDLDRAIRIIRKAESRADAAEAADEGLQARRGAGRRDPRDPPLPAGAARDREDPRRAGREEEAPEGDRGAARRARRRAGSSSARSSRRSARSTATSAAPRFAAGEELAYDPEAYIVHEEAVVVLSRDGWMKRVREVKDPTATRLREGDALAAVLPGTTRDRLVLFSTPRHRSTCCASPTCRRRPATASRCSRSSSSATASAWWWRGWCASRSAAPGAAGAARVCGGEPGAVVPGRHREGLRLPLHARPVGDDARRPAAGARRRGRRDRLGRARSLGPAVVVATAKGKMLRFVADEVAELSGPGRGVILMRPDGGRPARRRARAAASRRPSSRSRPRAASASSALADVPVGPPRRQGAEGGEARRRRGDPAGRRVARSSATGWRGRGAAGCAPALAAPSPLPGRTPVGRFASRCWP